MNNIVILQGKDENEIYLILHPFTWERKIKKNEDAKKPQKNAKRKRKKKTKTHIFMNEDAYFQERRRKKKIKTETQILEERYTCI